MPDELRLIRKDHILEITLDRPKANAIDAATSRKMSQAFAKFRDDPDLWIAILTGAGTRFFSAGWDLKAAAKGEADNADFGEGGFGGINLPDLNKPVIMAVNGMAVGGGFEVALGGDLIVAAEHAVFQLPEVRVGTLPDAGLIRLTQMLPRALAMEILIAGRQLSAQEALGLGLINRVVAADKLMATAYELAQEILKGAPLAVRALMQAVRISEGTPYLQAYWAAQKGQWPIYETLLGSEDGQEGARAFAEKRAPNWKGE